MSFGFLTMAFGPEKYLRQAETLALSLRLNMPGYKIAIVTDRTDANNLFDDQIPIRAFETPGTILKIGMHAYSPFLETMFIDSDCVVVRPFETELAAIKKFDFSPVVARYLAEGDEDAFIEDVGLALKGVGGTRFPKFNGGVYFFRKGDVSETVFARATEFSGRAKQLGIKNFDVAGPGDETLFGLALASMGSQTLYNDAGRLMRTPINSVGPIVADPIKHVSSFLKEGMLVEPAIVHYAGDWIEHHSYRLAEIALRTGRQVPWHVRTRVKCSQMLASGFRRVAGKAVRVARGQR